MGTERFLPAVASPHARVFIMFLVSLLVMFSCQLRAKQGGSSATGIEGTVFDPQGRGVQGARVEVSDGSGTTELTTVSAEDGSFFIAVPPDHYLLQVRFPGFAEWKREVEVGGTVSLPIQLSLKPFEDVLMVTVTRNQDAAAATPMSTAVVDRIELRERMPTNIGEALQAVPGMYLSEAGPFRPRPILRGLDSNRVLVLVDGQRLNNGRTSTGNAGIEPSLVDIHQVERIEVSKGTGSVLYGSDAMSGVINIITRRNETVSQPEFHGTFLSEYQSVSDGLRFNASHSILTPAWDLRIGGSIGEFEDFKSPAGEVPNSGAEEDNLEAAFTVRPGPRDSLRVAWTRRRGSDVGVPGLARGGPFFAEFPFDNRDKVDILYQHEGSANWERLQGSLYWQDQERNFFNVVSSPRFSLASSTTTDTQTIGAEVQSTQKAGAAHRLTYGGGFYRDKNEDLRIQTIFPETPRASIIDESPSVPKATLSAFSGFLQDQWTVTESISLNLGVRTDVFRTEADPTPGFMGPLPESRTDSTVTGQAGVVYQIDRNWEIFGRVGRGFREPNLFERFFFGRGSVGGFVVPNPDLDPETAFDQEGGVRFQSHSVRIEVAYFHNRIENLITTVPGTFMGEETFGGQPVSTNDNVDDARIQGVEGSLEVNWSMGGSWWRLFSRHSYLRGSNLTTDEPLPLIAPYTVLSGLTWFSRSGRMSLGAEMRNVAGGDRVPPGQPLLSGFSTFAVQGEFRLFDEFGFFPGAPGMPGRLNIRVENLSDKLFRELFNSVPAPGLNVKVSLAWDF